MYADGVNQAARRKPHTEQDWVAAEWAWAWPANRRILYNRASAAPDGAPWSDRKALVWWDAGEGRWTGHDVPDFVPDRAPSYRPPEDATGPDALRGDDPFIMQADGKGWLYAPAGLEDGPLPTHYEPQDSPVRNALYPEQQRSPVRQLTSREGNRYHPSGDEPGSGVFPYVVTTYRLTEHFTAGGMTRWSPYLAELQPELFCEISPNWPRSAAWNRRLGDDGDRARRDRGQGAGHRADGPLRVGGRTVHQIGLPFHWGPNGDAPATRPTNCRHRARPERAHPGGQGADRGHPPGRRPRPGPDRAGGRNRRARASPSTPGRRSGDDRAMSRRVRRRPQPAGGRRTGPRRGRRLRGKSARVGFFTDTSVCIGCKACEVACKEWNAIPEDGLELTGMSYDNTQGLGGSTWRHVAFVEQNKPLGHDDGESGGGDSGTATAACAG